MRPPSVIRERLNAAGARDMTAEANRSGDDGFAWRIGGLLALVSWGGGWDHVSASAGWGPKGATRCPTWEELESLRRIFFEDEETVVQISPPRERYRSIHPYVLHLWRPQTQEIPLPPVEFV